LWNSSIPFPLISVGCSQVFAFSEIVKTIINFIDFIMFLTHNETLLPSLHLSSCPGQCQPATHALPHVRPLTAESSPDIDTRSVRLYRLLWHQLKEYVYYAIVASYVPFPGFSRKPTCLISSACVHVCLYVCISAFVCLFTGLCVSSSNLNHHCSDSDFVSQVFLNSFSALSCILACRGYIYAAVVSTQYVLSSLFTCFPFPWLNADVCTTLIGGRGESSCIPPECHLVLWEFFSLFLFTRCR
jgi:hypothetical protein